MSTEIEIHAHLPSRDALNNLIKYCRDEFGSEPVNVDENNLDAEIILRAHGDRVQLLEHLNQMGGEVTYENIQDDY